MNFSILPRMQAMPQPNGGVARLISKKAAAQYCSISTSTYDRWAASGLVPGYVSGTHRIDRVELEKALDRMSNIEANDNEPSPLENWRAKSGGAS